MRKIIVTEFITLDGVIEAPGGDETPHPHGGWQTKFRSQDAGQYKVDELNSVDALLLGRRTFDTFEGYWPNNGGNPFADRINEMPKYVLSNSVKTTAWNNCHFLTDLPKDIKALKNSDGGNILVYGSATLVKGLLKHDLIDELRLMLYPISIGGGLRLFDESRDLKNFSLTSSRAVDNGVLILEYKPIS